MTRLTPTTLLAFALFGSVALDLQSTSTFAGAPATNPTQDASKQQNITSLIHDAREHYNKTEFSQAVELLDRVMVLDPTNEKAALMIQIAEEKIDELAHMAKVKPANTRDGTGGIGGVITKEVDIRSALQNITKPGASQAEVSRVRADKVREIEHMVMARVAPETWHDRGGSLGELREENGKLGITQLGINAIAAESLVRTYLRENFAQTAIEMRVIVIPANLAEGLHLVWKPRDDDSSRSATVDTQAMTAIVAAESKEKQSHDFDLPTIYAYNGVETRMSLGMYQLFVADDASVVPARVDLDPIPALSRMSVTPLIDTGGKFLSMRATLTLNWIAQVAHGRIAGGPGGGVASVLARRSFAGLVDVEPGTAKVLDLGVVAEEPEAFWKATDWRILLIIRANLSLPQHQAPPEKSP